MTWNLDEAKKDLIRAIDKIKEDSYEEAKESLLENTQDVITTLFDGRDSLIPCLIGVNWLSDDGADALTWRIYDMGDFGYVYTFDPIKDLFEIIEAEDPEEAESRISTAISALQSGIDRIRAYEAERRKAQS